MNKLKLLLPVLLILLFSCGTKEEEIKDVKFWKYAEGTLFADVLSFNSKDFSIKNDTIFKLNVPEYRITAYETRVLSRDQVLKIKEIKTGKTARYVSK